MGSQTDALDLRKAGLVSGFFPGGAPRERRDELKQPINPHKDSDDVKPHTPDVATRLTSAEYSKAFGTAPTAVDDTTLAIPVDEPSLAGELDAAAVIAPGAGTAAAPKAKAPRKTAAKKAPKRTSSRA